MIMPGDGIVNRNGDGAAFLAVAVLTMSLTEQLVLICGAQFITRDLITVLTCGMGYTLVRNVRPVTIVTSMV